MSEAVGEVGEIRGEIEIEWKIANFFSEVLYPEEDAEFRRSPEFNFLSSSWYLVMKIQRECDHSSADWIGLYVMKGDCGPAVSMAYTLGLRRADGRTETRIGSKGAFHKYSGLGSSKFLLRSDLLSRKAEVAPSDILTVICSLKRSDPNVVARTDKLAQDLMKLMISGDDSDVTITVGGTQYTAHRNILGARTPVFASMFRHEMTEKATGMVDIGDCDIRTFQTFLKYVYSGTVDSLPTKNLTALYKVADKYQVDELKSDCLDYMKNTFSVEKFCDVMTLALRHDEKELMQRATEFFHCKENEITATEKWKTFLEENPSQANKLLTSSPPNKNGTQ